MRFYNILKSIIKNFKNYIIKLYNEYFPDLIAIPLKVVSVINLLSLLLHKRKKFRKINKKILLSIFNLTNNKNDTKKVIKS